jgi:hypothetical protein
MVAHASELQCQCFPALIPQLHLNPQRISFLLREKTMAHRSNLNVCSNISVGNFVGSSSLCSSHKGDGGKKVEQLQNQSLCLRGSLAKDSKSPSFTGTFEDSSRNLLVIEISEAGLLSKNKSHEKNTTNLADAASRDTGRTEDESLSMNSAESDTNIESEEHNEANHPPLMQKKSVSFSEVSNETFVIEHLENISEDLATALWYNRKALLEIQKEYEAVLFLIETGRPINEDHHASRGLEKRTEDGAWALYEITRDATNAVLIEQDRQKKLKCFDAEQIAIVYQMETNKTRQAAEEQGTRDAKEVEEYLQEVATDRSSSKVRSPDDADEIEALHNMTAQEEEIIAWNRLSCTVN